ncbi:hypothetical protein AB0O34_20800 [Sphaerisporangium sp. NPDC088356]|uniref:hypothetical protein n=1 Tax=Sphaerisporangium sp. NPDC088356 TaxID=3154871 RepID=UPI00342E738D
MSGNGASGFAYDGFHIEEKWPGLDVNDGVDIHHSTVKNLIKALEDDVERLKGIGAGTAQHLKTYGKVASEHLGEWDAAQDLALVFTQGHGAISSGYESLVAQYEAAIAVTKASFLNLGKADHSSDVGTTSA